jgi:3-dehydroquinate synthase
VGVALDTLYSARSGWLPESDAWRVISLLQELQLPIWHEALELRGDDGRRRVFNGLEEFREHLGGQLTVLMLQAIGTGFDLHEMDEDRLEDCMEKLKETSHAATPA